MKSFGRRKFLKASLGAMAVAGSTERARAAGDLPFPAVAPEAVQVDPEALSAATAFIDAEIAAGTIPGAGLVATRHGKTFVSHFRGAYRDATGGDQSFHAGVANPLFSFSKGVTATVAVQMQQAGRIHFDDPVVKYIPEYKGGGKDGTTVRHLLTHAAGIPMEAFGPVDTEEAWQGYLKQLCKAEVTWPPGSRTAYHGLSGMFLVGEVIRSVSDRKPWIDICRDHLLDPIGATGFTFTPDPAQSPTAVVPGYFEALGPGKGSLPGHPAGGMFARPEDMLRLLNMIVQGGTWNGRTLIEKDAWNEMLAVQYADTIAEAVAAGKTPAHESWGIGWLVRGTAPTCPGGPWFGFGDGTSPTLFGHAGVDTIYGVGDPARGLAFVLVMTAKLPSAEESTRLRREVSNRVQAAVR
jgi:CubicO group peptidase (beta-lactamase class C family)